MTRLYADENFPLPVVRQLRALGYDILTIQEDGKANQRHPDPLVLRDATTLNRALLTINRKDFRKLHQQSAEHSGIISCTYDPDHAGQAQRIHESLQTHTPVAGKLILIYRPK